MPNVTGCVAEHILKALEAEIVSHGGSLDAIKAYGPDRYAREIEEAARAFWKDGSRGSFTTRMNATIKFGLRDAFDLGAADVGISPEDYIDADIRDRDAIIDEEKSHVGDLLDYLDGLANDPKATLDNASTRLQMWGQRFGDMRNRAALILGKDEKMEWVYDPEKEHCSSCERLNGVVKRVSFWMSHGVQPRNPPNEKLECGGWQCGCILQPTKKPVKRGGLPTLP